MKSFLKRFLNYPLSLLLLCVILYLSLFKPSGNDAIRLFANMDKVAHFIMYAVLSAVMWFEYYRSHSRLRYLHMLVMSFLVPVLFSGAMEYMQCWITNYRSADIVDFLFNVAGVVFANVVCIYALRPFLDKKLKKNN